MRPRRPSPAMLVALFAVFLAAGGASAVARGVSSLINGSRIKPGTISSKQVKDRSLLAKDFKSGQLPRGATGPRGDRGPQGIQGTAGSADAYSRSQADARFLPIGGTAANSAELGSLGATDFTQGTRTFVKTGFGSASPVPPFLPGTVLSVPFVGDLKDNSCSGGTSQVSFTNNSGQTEQIYYGTTHSSLTNGATENNIATSANPQRTLTFLVPTGASSSSPYSAGTISVGLDGCRGSATAVWYDGIAHV